MCTRGEREEKEEGREPTQTYGGSSAVQSLITGLAGVCAGQPTFPPFPSFNACFLFLTHSFPSLNLKTGSKTMSLHLSDTVFLFPFCAQTQSSGVIQAILPIARSIYIVAFAYVPTGSSY